MTVDDQLREAMKSTLAFQTANRALFDEINRSFASVTKLKLEELLPTITKSFSHLTSLQAEAARIRPNTASRMFELSQQATLTLSEGLSQYIKEISKPTQQFSEIIAADFRAIAPALEAMNHISLQSHLARASEVSLFAQKSLAGIDLKEIAKTLTVADSVRESFKDAHLNFAQQYSDLFRSIELNQARLSPLISELTYLPSVEFYRGTRVVQAVTHPKKGPAVEEAQIIANLDTEAANVVEIYLGHFNPRLIPLWQGAAQALESTNPDSVRHFITSLRELLTQVIHSLSPDDNIRAWSNAPEHYRENRPTRRARLLYICREINHKPFDLFLEKDIDSLLASFEIFQRGTHQVDPPFSKTQLQALQLRAESAIRFLIDLSKRTSGV